MTINKFHFKPSLVKKTCICCVIANYLLFLASESPPSVISPNLPTFYLFKLDYLQLPILDTSFSIPWGCSHTNW